MGDLVTSAEKSVREGSMRELFKTTRKLSRKRSRPGWSVKNSEGKTIAEIRKRRKRWVEHPEELLNRSALLKPTNIKRAHKDLPIDSEVQHDERQPSHT